MKIRYNNVEIEVDELRVDRYYRHIGSDTLWKIHSIQSTPIGNVVDLELINEYGDTLNKSYRTNMNGVLARVGTFEEISREEFERRRG